MKSAATAYKETSIPVQYDEGKDFIQELNLRQGDTILDLGCGTGELAAYLAERVAPEGRVVGVDPDSRRIKVAQETHGHVANLTFVEGSSEQFPNIGSETYDLIFSSHVLHWIADKKKVFTNVHRSLKKGGVIAVQYHEDVLPLVSSAITQLNTENAASMFNMIYFESRAKCEQLCAEAGFQITKSYDVPSRFEFESMPSFLEWMRATTHGAFDLQLVTKERLDMYIPPSSVDGKPAFVEDRVCRLIAVKIPSTEQK